MWIEMTAVAMAWVLLWVVLAALLWAAYYVLSLPLRRQEKGRLFLDLLEASARTGQAPETFLASLARTGDTSLGAEFPKVAARLDAGARLSEALAAVPEFLPTRFNAMLRVGLDTVEPSRLASLCSRGLTDARSQVLGAMNYLMVMVLAVGPVACCVFSMLVVFVLPKYQAIMQELDVPPPPLLQWLIANAGLLIGVMAGVSLLLLLAMVLYIGGPRLSRKLQRTVFPWTDRIAWALPWKRNRLRRDFIASLAASLDAGVPEARAVSLAADATANTVAMRIAGRMTRGLGQGRSLLDVLGCMDRSKELEWRVRNAVHGSTGFAPALRGWIEALDARAFRQEQAVAQVATTALVLWFGLIVGLIVVGVFQPLIAIINTAALW